MGAPKIQKAVIKCSRRLILLMGTAAPILSLLLGIIVQTIFYEVAHNLPPVYRQDSHITLPLCNVLPNLYGCEPWAGAWTVLEIWEISQKVGQVSGLLLNLVLVTGLSFFLTIKFVEYQQAKSILIGLISFITSLTLVLMLNIPLNIQSPLGIFVIASLLFIPLGSYMGGKIGKQRRNQLPSLNSINFLIGDPTIRVGFAGESLSKRELEVLVLVAQGYNNNEIAKRLYISKATVKTHLQHVYSKLGVKNRTSAVTQALALKLIRQDEVEEEIE